MSAVALTPITPSLSRKVFQQLGYTDAQFEVSSKSRSSSQQLKETRWSAPYSVHEKQVRFVTVLLQQPTAASKPRLFIACWHRGLQVAGRAAVNG